MDLLNSEQQERYERNILLKGIGEEGQKRLLRARVLVIGAGGLGSPVAYYLAAAGVGCLGLIDGDVVSLSNLQRQILHRSESIGQPKVESGRKQLAALNPDIRIETYCTRFTEDMASLVADYDVVVDCTDNFATRFLINDVCLHLGKPFIYGGVVAFSGQTTTIVPGKGPCLRCIFPEEPAQNISDPSDHGILGTVPGVIGVLQATEVVKYILDLGELLIGRLLTYNALAMAFCEVPFERNPDCRVCAKLKPAST